MEYLIYEKHWFMTFLEHPVQVKKVGIQFNDKSENVALYVGRLFRS